MKTKTKKIVRKLTPSQTRAKIVSALKALGYTLSEQVREHGTLKAWLRAPANRLTKAECDCGCTPKRLGDERAVKREALRIDGAITRAGLAVSNAYEAYGGEWRLSGARYNVTVNQESDTGNAGGAFVEVR